jgi:hypothetical protein
MDRLTWEQAAPFTPGEGKGRSSHHALRLSVVGDIRKVNFAHFSRKNYKRDPAGRGKENRHRQSHHQPAAPRHLSSSQTRTIVASIVVIQRPEIHINRPNFYGVQWFISERAPSRPATAALRQVLRDCCILTADGVRWPDHNDPMDPEIIYFWVGAKLPTSH